MLFETGSEGAEDVRQEAAGDILERVELPRLLADQHGGPRHWLTPCHPLFASLDLLEDVARRFAVAGPAERVRRHAAVRQGEQGAGEAFVVREAVGAVRVAA